VAIALLQLAHALHQQADVFMQGPRMQVWRNMHQIVDARQPETLGIAGEQVLSAEMNVESLVGLNANNERIFRLLASWTILFMLEV